MSSTTTISPTPSSTASSNGADSCGSMGPQYAPSTCPRTTSYDTTSTLLETAEFLENVPQSFRNAQQRRERREPRTTASLGLEDRRRSDPHPPRRRRRR